MFNINTNAPLSPVALAALYRNGDPHLGSQAQGWIDEQASNLIGPGGASNFFAQQHADQYNLAAAAQQRQLEAVRNAPSVAGLQNQTEAYPLPTSGTQVALRPLDQAEAARLGQSPEAYVLNRRLRMAGVSPQLVPNLQSVENQGETVSSGRARAGGISAEDLYNEPSFQAAMHRSPEKAHAVFKALTGTPLFGDEKSGGFHEAYQGRRVAEIKQGTADLHEALKEGKATIGADGKVMWRKMVPDPITGKLALGADFEEGNAYQRSLGKYTPNVSKDIGEFQHLLTQRPTAAPFTALQHPDLETPQRQGLAASVGTQVANYATGVVKDFGRFLNPWSAYTASPNAEAGGNPQDFMAPTANPQQRIAQLVRQPKFQELLRKDPSSAQRIIAAMRTGQSLDQSPIETPMQMPAY